MAALLLLSWALGSEPAEDPGTWVCVMDVHGRPVYEAGYPRVPGAEVDLHAEGSHPRRDTPIAHVITDTDGCARLDPAVAQDVAFVRVRAAGYATRSTPFVLRRGDPFYVFGDPRKLVAWIDLHPGLPLTTHRGTVLYRENEWGPPGIRLDMLPGWP